LGKLERGSSCFCRALHRQAARNVGVGFQGLAMFFELPAYAVNVAEAALYIGSRPDLLWAALFSTAIFAFYVGLVLWAFYRVMGYSFFKANHYVWRYLKKRLRKLDDDFRGRFKARGFNYATYYRARDLAIFLAFLFVLFVVFSPRDWAIVGIFASGVLVVLVVDSCISFWRHLRAGNRGTLAGFVRIYYLPAIMLVTPIFGGGKALTFFGQMYGVNTLIALH
jgi:hypothetical protein